MTDAGEGATSTALYSWVYDDLSRLTQESYDYGDNNSPTTLTGHTTDDYTKTYTFDLDGNRITQTLDISSDNGISGGVNDQVVQYTYDKDNELTLEETDNYNTLVISPITTTTALKYKNSTVYDANGSPTSLTHIDSTGTATTTYTSDLRNRMASVTTGTITTTYSYDDDGNIVSQKIGAGTPTTYLWDSNNPTGYAQVLEVWMGGGTPADTYTIANNVIGQNVAGVVNFIMTDGEGTTRQLTAYTPGTSTTNGHVTARYDYDGFGVPIDFRNSSHAANTANSSIGYQGEYVDPITGMSIMGAREYSAQTGRFWTMDGISLTAGDLINANLYLFVGANPLNLSDPTGHAPGVPLTLTDTLSAFSLGEGFELQDAQAGAIVFAGVTALLGSIALYESRSSVLASSVSSWGNNVGTAVAGVVVTAATAAVKTTAVSVVDTTIVMSQSVRHLADIFGIPAKAMGDIIHQIKRRWKGNNVNPDLYIDPESGDVSIEGTDEVIDNVYDYIPEEGEGGGDSGG